MAETGLGEITDTRDQILHLLKTHGPQSASALGERLNITSVAVRQHLEKLAGDGLVDYEPERQPVGRPVHVYHLTPEAETHFPDGHAELAVDMLDAVEAAFGPQGLRRLIAERTAKLRPRYMARLDAADSLRERVAALADLRRLEGYMATWRPDPDDPDGESLLLIENHCPICEAAQRCRQLCAGELELFRDCLGDNVQVTRTEHILGGQRRCVYRIVPGA